ncbi:uncharacterized protein M421DRAFT_424386, partial [Didymella exigua CBS 183.55]
CCAGGARVFSGRLTWVGDSLVNHAITKAAKAAIPQCSTTAKSKPWWNQDLKALRTSMLSKQRQLQRELAFSLTSAYTWKRDYLIARNSYLQAVKIAKRDH